MRFVPDRVITVLRRRAATGFTTGRDRDPTEAAYLDRCTAYHAFTGTVVMFTRDTGHHTSGWFKNPEYERCLHLSISFRQAMLGVPVDRLLNPNLMEQYGTVLPIARFDRRLAAQWVEKMFYPHANLTWEEAPFSKEGKQLGVRHWRLFCNIAWQPIHPRGEVYSLDFTEKGWKSWSEVQGEDAPPNWVDAS